jgi:Asp-tRNA(Asn)/Glu-tRNA(Gln) amidotransferase A subunit family amidase
MFGDSSPVGGDVPEALREALANAQVALGYLLAASRPYLVSGRVGPHEHWALASRTREEAIAALEAYDEAAPSSSSVEQAVDAFFDALSEAGMEIAYVSFEDREGRDPIYSEACSDARPVVEKALAPFLSLSPENDEGDSRADLQSAVDRAYTALMSSAYVGGPSHREAWQTALDALWPVVTQQQGQEAE